MSRSDFEPGLLAADVVAERGLRTARPVRTIEGDLVVMVEWPQGTEHPLALLEYVGGTPIDPTTAAGAEVAGRVLGRVQAALTNVPRRELALDAPRDYLHFLRSAHQDLGDCSWLHSYNADLVAEIERLTADGLELVPGLWDGPEVVVDEASDIGLIDFGNVDLHPIAHVLGYGITQVSPPGRTNAQRESTFLEAFTSECKVPEAEMAVIGPFRKVTLATYAKFIAMRRMASRDLPAELELALHRLLSELEHR